jgi:Na+/melibiose symporter-like transporter
VGALLLVAWVVHDLRVDEPLLDLRVLARRTVLLANLATIGLGFVLFATYFLVPYLVQGSGRAGYGFGADTVQSGLFLLPAAAGQLVSGPLAPRLARLLSPKWVYALGLFLAAVAAAGLGLANGQEWLVALWTLLVGAGAGLAIGIGSDLVAEAVEPRESGIATSINSVLRRVGGGVGGQVAAALLVALAVGSVPTGSAFTTGFLAAAGASAVGVLLTLGIRSDSE